MLTTTNFKLKKPESTDYAKISDINDNMDIIDAEIAKRPTRDDMDDVIDTKFTVSTSRAKLTPGEKLKVLFGKIERWIEDLKDGAFSAVANNLTTTGAGSVLDARQGKALKDQVDTKANKADVVNNLTTTDYGYILDARQGKALSDKIDSAKSSLSASVATKLASANVVNNVTTKDAGYALDARQGKVLSDKIDSTKSSLQSSFQAGVDGIYGAITAQGTTPASKSQGDVQNAIKTLADAKYAAGNSAGVASVTVSASASGRTVTATASNGKTASASVALAGSNGTVSVSTAGGSGNQSFDITDGWCTNINVDRSGAYNQGVTDADNRVNSSSANYKGGYNAGYGDGYGAGKSAAAAKLSNIYVHCDRTSAHNGSQDQNGSAHGGFVIDTTNYSSAWVGSCKVTRGGATMSITSNSGATLFSLTAQNVDEKSGGNVSLNLSRVSSITVYIRPNLRANADQYVNSQGTISSLTFY